jgi:hypothetical protein
MSLEEMDERHKRTLLGWALIVAFIALIIFALFFAGAISWEKS